MIFRCYSKKCKDYKWYGGRGIIICDEWLNNYYKFQEWSINNNYSDDLTIDRIDANGNYEPNNCRWIPREDNCRFKRTTNVIEIDGIKKSASQWSIYIGRGRNYINNMLKKYDYNYVVNYIKKIISSM